MNVVGHQNIRMNQAVMAGGCVCKALQVEATVSLGEEAGLTVVAALDEVKRTTGKNDPW